MKIKTSTYEGKKLYYNHICNYRCFFHRDFVKKTEYGGEFEYTVQFPIKGCDLIEVDNNLVVTPGSYNLFLFSCDGKIKEIDDVINVFLSKDNKSALILTDLDKVKIKWNDEYGQWITALYKNGTRDDIPTEEILKYL